jgi:CRISPR-associated exonuclease Cas4
MEDNQLDYLPLSYLNQLEYCERRFWLMFVQGEMAINAAVLEGTQQHESAHTAGTNQDGAVVVRRRLYIWSDRLRVAGFADVVEEREGGLFPIEYKRGRMGRWLNDHIQLCAQALCLEERTSRPIDQGEIFYWGSRRRVRVELSTELRDKTKATVARAFELLAAGRLPKPLTQRAKCRDCSLEPICLPREVEILERKG